MTKKKTLDLFNTNALDAIEMNPLFTPLEASMLPAREKKARGALHHAMSGFCPQRLGCGNGFGLQRQKIWVRYT